MLADGNGTTYVQESGFNHILVYITACILKIMQEQ